MHITQNESHAMQILQLKPEGVFKKMTATAFLHVVRDGVAGLAALLGERRPLLSS